MIDHETGDCTIPYFAAPVATRRADYEKVLKDYYSGAIVRCTGLWLPVAGVTLLITTIVQEPPDIMGQHFGWVGLLVVALGWCYELWKCGWVHKRTKSLRLAQQHRTPLQTRHED